MQEWRAYGALEPFGNIREDMRAGMLAQLFYNSHRGKDAEALNWHDFFGNVETAEIKEERTRKLRADPVKSSANAVAAFKAWNAQWDAATKKLKKPH